MRALLLLLLCLAHGAHSQKCSNATEFFGAQPCSNATGTCLACPSPNSVAIASNGPSGACACAPGFYATSTTFRCSTNRPPVEDSFACTRCPASIPQSLCEGGTYMAPAATATSLILTSLGGGSQLYVQCSNASSTSALCGGGFFAEKQGYRRVDIDAFLTTITWRMRHAPSSRCMIYGQRAFSSVCMCPSNSLVTYSYAKVKSQPVVPAVGWVWNLDVAPSFSADPTDPSTKYFGYCACAPGYYRANGAFSYGFFEPCLPCEQGFYCPGGSSAQNSGPRFACALGWTTAANASIAASDCRLCVRPSACGAGMYCDEANPLAWNNADRACVVCPAGYTCPLGKGKNACGPGTYQPRPSSDAAQCLACAPGSFAAGNASTSCSLCPPGTFAADNASTSCRPCEAGWFAARSGSATCSPCANGSVFQPLPGQAGCSRCPPGYVNRSGISSAASNTQLEQVCVACPIGKYSASIAAAECVVCPRDSWNGATGAAACTPCGNGRSTLGANGSTSESQCICPPTRIQTGTGFCLYPGTCAPNEYISNAACGICPSCPSTGYYIRPEAMCNGFKDFAASPASTCVPCKKEDTCGTSSSQKFSVLFPCKTGAISQDTSVCVDNALYRNPFDAKCKAGSYEDPYSEEGARYAFDAGVTRAVLNPNNTLIAELFGSSVRIWASETALQPLARASMLLHLYPEVAGVYPTRFMLSLDTGDGRTSPALAGPDVLGIDNSTARMPVPDTTRLLSSAVWSADGNILFVVWMDGTISKIVAMPKVSSLCSVPLLIFLAV